MGLSKADCRRLSACVRKLQERGIDISMEGKVATLKSPSGTLLTKYDLETDFVIEAAAEEISVVMTLGMGNYVARVCKPDHEVVEDLEIGWSVDSCRVAAFPRYHYDSHTFHYTWVVGSGEKIIRRDESFDEWPKAAALLEIQKELVQAYKKLLPLLEYLNHQGVEPKFFGEQILAGDFLITSFRGKLVIDSCGPKESIEDPEGLSRLCQNIVILNLLKSYVTPKAKTTLEAQEKPPTMVVDFEAG